MIDGGLYKTRSRGTNNSGNNRSTFISGMTHFAGLEAT